MSETLLIPLAQISESRSGMISLRTDLGGGLTTSLYEIGLGMPGVRQMFRSDEARTLWMSPDELLFLCAPETTSALLDTLREAVAHRHHLLADVSDVRAMFTLSGPAPHQVLAKLCPVDLLDGFPAGEVRRTRLAQIPAAFWREGADFRLICFRSVADYAGTVLRQAALPGTAIDPLGSDL